MKNRGPNHSNVISKSINGKFLLFHATILHHQGAQMGIQPASSEDDNVILMFNGDLYMKDIAKDESDTDFLFRQIKNVTNENELIYVLTNLTGPFSIICKFGSKIFFARDALGRNSLLFGTDDDVIFISSVVDPSDPSNEMKVVEVPSLGIYVHDLTTDNFFLHPYKNIENHEYHQQQFEMFNQIIPIALEPTLHPRKSHKEKSFSFDFADLCVEVDDESQLFDHLLSIPEIAEVTNEFITRLTNSIKDRIGRVQDRCKNCKVESSKCDHSKIGILFSGGVDCSLVAVLTSKLLSPEYESIDLMNVSFEKATNKQAKIDWNVPDRITGLETLEELRSLCPNRSWNFVEINITRQQLNENLPKLSSLVYPLSNVLDESLGAALYFASRGVGLIDEQPYESPCRVLLIGSGADELFGGYTRHRNAFKRSSENCDLLTQELTLDWVRLPSRNLARDDRVIGDHGITVRAPFIEENFATFTQKLTSTQKCYPKLSEGVGDKLLLRLCAYHVGLKRCCYNRKRALQFGSRIADKRQKATDVSNILKIKS